MLGFQETQQSNSLASKGNNSPEDHYSEFSIQEEEEMEGHSSLHLPCPNLARRATSIVCPRWGEVTPGETRLMLWRTS